MGQVGANVFTRVFDDPLPASSETRQLALTATATSVTASSRRLTDDTGTKQDLTPDVRGGAGKKQDLTPGFGVA